MRRCARICGALAVALFAAGQAYAAGPALRVGVMPSGTPGALLKQYTFLESYLEHALDVDIEVQSAPDFSTYLRRVLADQYEVAGMAPHLALLAVEQQKWIPLVSADYGIQPTLIGREDGPIHSIKDLRGRRVALPDRLALITMQGEAELARAGLVSGKSVEIIHTPNHFSVMEMVLRGLADAGFVSSVLLKQLAPERRAGLVVVHSFPGTFNYAYLASTRLPADERARLEALLVQFPNEPEGRAFFAPGRAVAMRPMKLADLEAFRPYLPIVKRRLALGGP